MNYQRIYDEIIERAKPRGLNKKNLVGYFERHHVIPKCLGGLNSLYQLSEKMAGDKIPSAPTPAVKTKK